MFGSMLFESLPAVNPFQAEKPINV
jgi:hypothetical protein